MTRKLDSFQSQLLEDLKARTTDAGSRHRGRKVIGLSALAVCAATGAIAAGTLLAPSGAYAVSQAADGDISITLTSLSDSAGLQEKLAGYGLKAAVDYSATDNIALHPDGTAGSTSSPEPIPTPMPGQSASTAVGAASPTPEQAAAECNIATGAPISVDTTDQGATITIPAGAIPRDKTLSITTAGGDKAFSAINVFWEGPNGPCGIVTATVVE